MTEMTQDYTLEYTPEVAEARGYRTVRTQAELERLGFSAPQCRVPALLIPVRNTTGAIATYQTRPDTPRILKGTVLKSETPREPGQSLKDRTRAAIQHLSGEIPTRTVYTHTGWTRINGAWHDLHAGRFIGPHLRLAAHSDGDQ